MSIEIDFLIIGDSSTYATWMEMKEINFVKNLSEARDVKAGSTYGYGWMNQGHMKKPYRNSLHST